MIHILYVIYVCWDWLQPPHDPLRTLTIISDGICLFYWVIMQL